jgi:hypothetical protein
MTMGFSGSMARASASSVSALPGPRLPGFRRLLHQLGQPVLARHRDGDGVVGIRGIQLQRALKIALRGVQVVVFQLLCASQIGGLSVAQLALSRSGPSVRTHPQPSPRFPR